MTVRDALMAAGLPIGSTPSFVTSGLGAERDDGALQVYEARDLLERVSIRPDEIEISLSERATETIGRDKIVAPWSKPPTRVQREIIAPPEGSGMIRARCLRTPVRDCSPRSRRPG